MDTEYNILLGRTKFAYFLLLGMEKYIFINEGQSQFFKHVVSEKPFIVQMAFTSAIFSYA